MRRRQFVSFIGGAAAWPVAVRAQRAAPPVIGFLNSASASGYEGRVAAFKKGMQETGYVADQNVAIEYRWAGSQFDRLPTLAADLIQRGVTVIAASGSPNPAQVAKAATTTIPIVFAYGGDPITNGLVSNLSRPGGNITGVTFFSNVVMAKRLGLLRELLPNAEVLAVLMNPNSGSTANDTRQAREFANDSRKKIVTLTATNNDEIDSAFAEAVEQKAAGLLIDADGLFRNRSRQLIALAEHYSLPTAYADRDYAVEGGLMSYGPSIVDGYRQCGNYVGQVLKGAKPGDLPVLQPTKFTFVLNLKTAKTLSLTIPSGLFAIADEVIE